jgi:hypothetical protein
LRALIELFGERLTRYIHMPRASTRAYHICVEVMPVHRHKAETDLDFEPANMLLISEPQDHEVRYQLGRVNDRTTW